MDNGQIPVEVTDVEEDGRRLVTVFEEEERWLVTDLEEEER